MCWIKYGEFGDNFVDLWNTIVALSDTFREREYEFRMFIYKIRDIFLCTGSIKLNKSLRTPT
jgi:hypothetical protein